MFLRAGILSLALLVASRLLGLVRESTLAAAFGATGLGDVAVLMLTLPDWLAGVVASGALAYVMLPAWAAHEPAAIGRTQRRLARALAVAGLGLALAIVIFRYDVLDLLAAGLPPALHASGVAALLWSAAAVPLALLASLWATRLQHERDFTGMYAANLVVNGLLIATLGLLLLFPAAASSAVTALGCGLLAAMVLRLAWLRRRLPAPVPDPRGTPPSALPAAPAWLWAAAAAGLPLALPFAARSIASGSGEGTLATFNYAWKLVELPLMLAIQLVATLAFPNVARAFAAGPDTARGAAAAVRPAMALAWSLACAAAAALAVCAPALAQLLFGWGRMDAQSLGRVAQWGSIGAWGLLPQALVAVALTVLAAQRRMQAAVLAFALALAVLLGAPAFGANDGASLMKLLNLLYAGVAVLVLASLGRGLLHWLPWGAVLAALAALGASVAAAAQLPTLPTWPLLPQLGAAALAAAFVLATAFACSADLRVALRR